MAQSDHTARTQTERHPPAGSSGSMRISSFTWRVLDDDRHSREDRSPEVLGIFLVLALLFGLLYFAFMILS